MRSRSSYVEVGERVECPDCGACLVGTVQQRTKWMRRHDVTHPPMTDAARAIVADVEQNGPIWVSPTHQEPQT